MGEVPLEYRDVASKTYVEEQIKANPSVIKKIPTERGLAEHFNVSRTTVKKALHSLMLEGYLFNNGKNLECSKAFEINMLKMSSLSEEVKQADNAQIKIKVISNKIITMPAELRIFFGSNEQLTRIIRQRVLGEIPLSYEITYLSSQKFKKLDQMDLNNVSLYQFLKDHYHLVPSHGREEITYEVVTKDKATYLQLIEGTPIYKVSSYSFDINFQPFEHTVQYLVGNKFRYHLSAKNIFDYGEKYK
ncbi:MULTISPECIES: GntR family transcriptional regulator [unclassified Gilliamella]|uniref:GntR family transcriptional regulator n=1 Tax=unclassified Gilliamella TaxID=2685620 RepID=UPI0013270918|nr:MULTISPECIES: GntR family transcriptional regulator [unclassified Gilliamella]MWN05160.1 UTRA domain-containing protein [Gilliamella sp. Pas-s95]MWP61940.1 UTRA domain-containing protein [Gilliamella sp. Pas-s25]